MPDAAQVQALLALAGEHHSKGRFARAVELCDQALAAEAKCAAALVQKARSFAAMGHTERALECFEQAVRQDPASPAALSGWRDTILAADDPAPAADRFRTAVETLCDTAPGRTELGRLFFALGRHSHAVAELETAIRQDPGYAEAYVALASVLADQGQPGQAIVRCQEAFARDPARPDVHSLWRHAIRALEPPDAAIEQYRAALKTLNDEALASRLLGDLYTVLERHDQAFAQYENALEKKAHAEETCSSWEQAIRHLRGPAFETALERYRAALLKHLGAAAAHARLGDLCLRRRKYDRALAELQAALQTAPDQADAWWKCGLAHANLKQHDKAIACYREAIANDPRLDEPFRLWRIALVELGAPEAAVEEFRATVEQQRDDSQGRKALGELFADLKRYDTAAEEFQKAIAQDPQNADACLALGQVFEAQSQFDEAAAQFQAAVEQKNDLVAAYDAWRELIPKLADPDPAAEQYRKAIDSYNSTAEARTALAALLVQLERYSEACAEYEKVARKRPEDANLHGNWGDALLIIERYDEARARFEKLHALDPDNSRGYLGIALSLTGKHQPDEAIGWYRQAIHHGAGGEALLPLSSELIQLGQYDEAMAACQTAAKDPAHEARACHNMAYALWREGQYGPALVYWNKARDAYLATPGASSAAYRAENCRYLAMICHHIAWDLPRAEKALEDGLKLNPHDPGLLADVAELQLDLQDLPPDPRQKTLQDAAAARTSAHWKAWQACRQAKKLLNRQMARFETCAGRVQLASLHLLIEEYDEAEQAATRALALDPDQVPAHHARALAQIGKQDFQNALKSFEAARRRDPDSFTLWAGFADACFRAGMKDKAEAEYRKILAVAPGCMEALIGLAKVCAAIAEDRSQAGQKSDAEQLFSQAVESCSQAISLHEKREGASRPLKRRELDELYYLRGYTRVKLFEMDPLGIKAERPSLAEAEKDFEQVSQTSVNYYKAKGALEKIRKRATSWAPGSLAEKTSPWIICLLSFLMLAAAQYAFFVGRPVLQPGGSAVTYTALSRLDRNVVPEGVVEKLKEGMGNVRYRNAAELAERLKQITGQEFGKYKDAILPQVVTDGDRRVYQPIGESNWLLCTFSSLIFMLAGLTLPRLLKLKFGAIELEKQALEPAKAPGPLALPK